MIVRLQWGVYGAAIAMSISHGTAYFIQEYYVKYLKWDFFKDYTADLFIKESFEGWGEFIKLAIPTTSLTCIAWWAFEIAIILAGVLGVNENAA